MKCKCYLNNNYQIIGVCDIDKFNEKIREFNDKSWNQIILPKKLTLPNNLPNVNNVTKLYIDIKITFTKIINSPLSNDVNVEGLKLTGKILLVSGNICEKIIYVADNVKQSIHSFKFNFPFNTYIVIDENTDIDNDKYCVYPCIEDVSIRVLDKRNLGKSITLFLFAHKIQVSLNINNEIIFYDFPRKNKKEVVRVSFDNNKRTLIATSTGNPYNSPNDGYTIWFELKDKTGTVGKAKGEVLRNQDGTDFVNDLNEVVFEEEDLIFINYQVGPNVVLTNFPSGENYDMNFVGNRIFKITKDGIVPTMLPNVISLTSIDNKPVFNLGFDTHLKLLLPNPPTPAVTNPTYQGQEYFKIIVKDSNLTEKYRVSIQGNQTGYQITNDLLNKPFDYGDIIELDYQERQRVSVTDNPYPSSTKYNLKGDKTSFRITENGLEVINKPIMKLQNAIILSNSSNQEMLKIEFDINNLQVIAKATDAINNNYPGEMLFGFKINSFNKEIKFGETAKDFALALDGEPFNFSIKSLGSNYNTKAINANILNGLFKIRYKEEANINLKITNYPSQGNDFTPRNTPPFEDFKIEQTGLIITSSPPVNKLPNKITIKSKTNQEVASIEFNKDTSKFIVNSTGVIPDLSSASVYDYFILERWSSYDGFDYTTRFTLKSNEDGGRFITNNTGFSFDEIFVIRCKDKSKIEISNYPSLGMQYVANENIILLKITLNGLIDASINSKFKIFNDNNNEVATIQILKTEYSPIILTYSTGEISTNTLENTQQYVQFLNYKDSNVKKNGIINGKENANNFAGQLPDGYLESGNPVKLSNKIPNRVKIINYKSLNEYYVSEEAEFLVIENDKLIPYNLDYNKITLSNNDGTNILFVYFDKVNKAYFIYSTGVLNRDSTFTFKLLDSLGTTTKFQKTINNGQTADLINTGTLETFEFNDIIELSYSDGSLVEITDIPNKGDIYNPQNNREKFRIERTGLQSLTPPPVGRLANTIIIKSKTNQEVARVEINKDKQKFIVNTTGVVADSTKSEVYFTLILKNNLGVDIIKSVLNSNENGDKFKADLNNKDFDYNSNNILVLIYKDKTKIQITNYPVKGNDYTPEEYANLLEVTQDALLDKSLSSKIKIYNDDNNEVSTIQFLEIDSPTIRKMIVTSTGETSTNRLESTQQYVQFNNFIARNFFDVMIFGKKDAKDFSNKLNNKSVNTGLPIKLSSKISNRISITNYKNQAEYRIDQEPEFISVEDSLMPYKLNYNKIRLKNNDNSNVLFIYFMVQSTIYIFYSTGVLNTDLDNFEVRLWDSSERFIKLIKSIERNQTADLINTPLREIFNVGDVLELSYSDRNLVEITDIPNKGDVYNPNENFEKFRLTLKGLQKITRQIQKLQNVIFVVDEKGRDVVVIDFDITNKKIIANATDNINTAGSGTLLDFRIYRDEYVLRAGENAKSFASKINNHSFEFGDEIRLITFNVKYVIITNYPTINKIYNPTSNFTSFKIEKTGLVKTS